MEEDNVDVLSSHVKFTRMKKNVNETDVSEVDPQTYENYPRKARQNPEPSAVSKRVKPSPGSKVRVERVVLVIVCFLLIAALAALACEYIKTKEMLRSEKVMWEADRANLTESLSKMKSSPTARPPVCPTTPQENRMCSCCDPGWEPYGAKCYYFSVDLFSWEKSKQRCMNLNGNLVKIDSRDEQEFLVKKLRTKMKEPEDRFWIGLTDVAKEGEWRWVDGSKLDDNLKFWHSPEPNNSKGKNGEYPDGEDCGRMGWRIHEEDLNCWSDCPCTFLHSSICEKAAESLNKT